MKKILLTIIPAIAALSLCLLAANGCSKGGGLKTGKSSAEKTSFEQVASHLDAGGNLYLYLSTAEFLDGLSGKVARWRRLFEAIPDPEDRETIGKVFDVLGSLVKDSGIEDVSGFGVSAIATEPGFYHTKTFVHHYSGKGTGFLWKILGQDAHEMAGLKMLPANTALATFSDLDVPLAWSVIEKEVRQSGFPQAEAFLRQVPQKFEMSTGLKWDKVLESLGGEFGLVLTLDESRMIPLPMGGLEVPEPALMLVAKVKDPTIFNRIDGLLQQQAGEQVIRVDKGDLKMRTVPVPLPLPIQLRPTIATSGGYLFIGSSDLIIQEALAVKSGDKKGLTSTEEFKHLSKDIPKKGNQFTFLSERFGKTAYQIQEKILESASQRGRAAGLQREILSLFRSEAPFTYNVSANLDEGWLTTGNGNQHPTKTFFAYSLVVPAALAAIAIPNFVKARTVSQRNACINNLRMIDGAKAQWALENRKQGTAVPTNKDLQAYLGRGMNSSFPVCPQGGEYTINQVDKSPTCSIPDHVLQ